MTDIGDGLSYEILTIVSSIDEVLAQLGGAKRVAALTRCSRSSVWNWRQAQRFPARHYRVIRSALWLRGCRPDLRLFAFTSPDEVPVVDVAA